MIKGALLGHVIKGLGFNKDLYVYNIVDEQIARIKFNVKMAATSI